MQHQLAAAEMARRGLAKAVGLGTEASCEAAIKAADDQAEEMSTLHEYSQCVKRLQDAVAAREAREAEEARVLKLKQEAAAIQDAEERAAAEREIAAAAEAAKQKAAEAEAYAANMAAVAAEAEAEEAAYVEEESRKSLVKSRHNSYEEEGNYEEEEGLDLNQEVARGGFQSRMFQALAMQRQSRRQSMSYGDSPHLTPNKPDQSALVAKLESRIMELQREKQAAEEMHQAMNNNLFDRLAEANVYKNKVS
jgi:hypothetical protein